MTPPTIIEAGHTTNGDGSFTTSTPLTVNVLAIYANPAIVVGVQFRNNATAPHVVQSATLGSQPLALIGADTNAVGTRTEVWGAAGLAPGTQDLTATLNAASQNGIVGYVLLDGVDADDPWGTIATPTTDTSTVAGTPFGITAAGATADDLIIDFVTLRANANGPTLSMTAATGRVERYNDNTWGTPSTADQVAACSTWNGGASRPMQWTTDQAVAWSQVAVNVHAAAPAGPATAAWENLAGAIGPDGDAARWPDLRAADGPTDWMEFHGWEFPGLPADPDLTGFQFRIRRDQDGPGGAVRDSVVQLWAGGTLVGANRAATDTWGTTLDYAVYGGSADTWGMTPTALHTALQQSDFAVRVSVENSDSSSPATPQIDDVDASLMFLGDPLAVPVAGLTVTPNPVLAGGTVTASTAGSTGTITRHAIDWGQGAGFEDRALETSHTHVYDTVGIYTVAAQVTGPGGTDTAEQTLIVAALNPDVPAQTIRVRERPPLRVSSEIVTPSGRRYRWSPAERDAANVATGLRWSSVMPGGWESADVTLARHPGVDYADLERLSTWRILDATGGTVGEYRLERAPRTSGDQMAISPSAVGWQAALTDDDTLQAVYVDTDPGRWTEGSLQRRIDLADGGYDATAVSVSADQGAIVWDVPAELPGRLASEVWYRAPDGVRLTRIAYQGSRTGNWTTEEAATLYGFTDDVGGGMLTTPLTLDDTARQAAPTQPRRYLMLRVAKTGTPGTDETDGAQQRIGGLAVYGDHGLALVDTGDGPPGVYTHDVIAAAVARGAPSLRFTTGRDGTITPDTFVIRHLVFAGLPTTAADVVTAVTRYGLQDWAVWERRTFHWHPRGQGGRSWRARVGPAGLQETGPQADRLWESIVVAYTDVDGSTRTAGPPGSGADTESAYLKDSDAANPANRLGLTRRDVLSIGTTTAARAVDVGRAFLEESRRLDTSGQARITGYVEDDRGTLWPHTAIRAGDSIRFADAADPSPRRIVHVSHDADNRASDLDLDAPPEGLQALLERFGAELAPLGIS
jgi:PKD repeat protein